MDFRISILLLLVFIGFSNSLFAIPQNNSSLKSSLEQISSIAKEAAQVYNESHANCQGAEDNATQYTRFLENANLSLDNIQFQYKELYTEALNIQREAAIIDFYINNITQAQTQLEAIKAKLQENANTVCGLESDLSKESGLKKFDSSVDTIIKSKRDSTAAAEGAPDLYVKEQKYFQKLIDLRNRMHSFQAKINNFKVIQDELAKMEPDYKSKNEKSALELNKITFQVKSLEVMKIRAQKIADDTATALRQQPKPLEEEVRWVKQIDDIKNQIAAFYQVLNDCTSKIQAALDKNEAEVTKYNKFNEQVTSTINQLSGPGIKAIGEKIDHAVVQAGDQADLIGNIRQKIPELLAEIDKCSNKAIALIKSRIYIEIPDVRDKSKEEAVQTLRELGLETNINQGKEAPSANLSLHVEKQNPLPGTKIQLGDKVDLVIFGPYQPLIIPDVKNMSLEEATSKLTGMHLFVNSTQGTIAPSKEKTRTVSAQTPAPGTKAKPGDTVTLTYFVDYQPLIEIPNVLGFNHQEASEKLKASQVSFEVILGDPAPSLDLEGFVYAQRPSAGSKVPPDVSIIVIAYGSFRIAVPSVTGLRVDQAAATILKSHLVPELIEGVTTSKKDQMGQVYAQSPRDGTILSGGATVKLTYYSTKKAEEQLTRTTELSGTFFVACRNFVPNLATNGENGAWMSNMTFIDSGKPLFLEIDEDAASIYPSSFFTKGKRISTSLVILGKDVRSGETRQYEGALLMEIQKVYKSREELATDYPTIRNLTAKDPMGFLRFQNNDGQFGDSTKSDNVQITWRGGPLTVGWPESMKERNFVLFRSLQ